VTGVGQGDAAREGAFRCQELTVEQFVTRVANIGGYTCRSSRGPPGSILIARGFERVAAAAAGLAAARGAQQL